MPTLRMLLLCSIALAGCAGKGSSPSTCEVLSPPDIVVPTSQDDQRIEAQTSGNPTQGQDQQDCP